MGIFSRKPKTYLGEKVLNVVKCAKCDKKMYIIEARGAEGGRCHACGKYLCSNCLRDLRMGSYKCCLTFKVYARNRISLGLGVKI